MDMAEQIAHLAWGERGALSEMVAKAFGFVGQGQGTGQVIKGRLAAPVDQVFRQIEGGRVAWGMQEFQADLCRRTGVRNEFGDHGQQRPHGRLHGQAVGPGVVQNQLA